MTTMDFVPLLQSMRGNLDRGAFPELGFQLDFYRPIALESGDASVIDAFDELKLQADAGLEHERVHGRWSLLKHDHPVTMRLKARGYYKDVN